MFLHGALKYTHRAGKKWLCLVKGELRTRSVVKGSNGGAYAVVVAMPVPPVLTDIGLVKLAALFVAISTS